MQYSAHQIAKKIQRMGKRNTKVHRQYLQPLKAALPKGAGWDEQADPEEPTLMVSGRTKWEWALQRLINVHDDNRSKSWDVHRTNIRAFVVQTRENPPTLGVWGRPRARLWLGGSGGTTPPSPLPLPPGGVSPPRPPPNKQPVCYLQHLGPI